MLKLYLHYWSMASVPFHHTITSKNRLLVITGLKLITTIMLVQFCSWHCVLATHIPVLELNTPQQKCCYFCKKVNQFLYKKPMAPSLWWLFYCLHHPDDSLDQGPHPAHPDCHQHREEAIHRSGVSCCVQDLHQTRF